MAVAAAIIVPAALLEDDDLLALGLRHDLGADGKPVDRLQLGALAREQHVAQRHLVTGFAADLLDDDLVSGGNTILLAACAHDCDHGPHHFPHACDQIGHESCRSSVCHYVLLSMVVFSLNKNHTYTTPHHN